MKVKSSEEMRKLKEIIKKDMDTEQKVPRKKLKRILDGFFNG